MPIIDVICPNVAPGSQVSVQGPGGEQLFVIVPSNVKPGQQFSVNIPDREGPSEPSPVRLTNGSAFKYPLFGCCDRGIGQCICMTLFMPCAIGNGMTRVRGRGYCGYLLFGTLPITHVHSRYKLREQFNLEGDFGNDLLLATACMPCSGYQVLNEIAHRIGQDFGLCGCVGECTDKHFLQACSCCTACCTGCAAGCRSCIRQCCCDV